MYKVIVTGPESSGKTTLCENLTKYFNLSFSKEYARLYLEKKGNNYNQSDLLVIAKGQLISEQNHQILDTDLITIKIWSEYKYGSCDSWILEKINKQKLEQRFYLLCKPDIQWKPDPLRENPINRDKLFELYKIELEQLELSYSIIEKENRLENAIEKISLYLS